MSEIIINKLPSPTWRFLKMNNAAVERVCPPNDASIRSDGTITKYRPLDEETLLFGSCPEAVIVCENDEEKVSRVTIESSGEYSAAAVDIRACENSELTVYVNIHGDRRLSVKINADIQKGAHVKLVATQLCKKSGELVCDIRSRVSECAAFTQLAFLPGTIGTYINTDAELYGDNSRFVSHTSYLADENDKLDINCNVSHKGRRTESEITANGALDSNAQKIFRGTIDFQRGSKGSHGSETENVLLLSDDIINRTLPVILCSEEDVKGTHGATIGDISGETLMYFQSRGISKEQAARLLKASIADSFLHLVNDSDTTKLIGAETGDRYE